ncbi:MAG: hypothetical protein AB7I42_25080 [Bradyrhizobium sp.]|uniref:hypothetical protein n=1 Tax=Bradyrhizobium sp. TaxID=376 RepID=UPI003D0DC2F0
MSDFQRDNDWQRLVRDEVLAPGFYGSYATDGRYVFIDKGRLASTLQKRFAVDTIVQGRDGAALCIEEKIVRWPGYEYRAYALETESCTKPGFESDGWMRYGQADYLLYAFMRPDRLDVHLIDFPKLQAWFGLNEDRFERFGPLPTFNRSAGRKVPISEVKAAVPFWTRAVYPDPTSPHFDELFPRVAA